MSERTRDRDGNIDSDRETRKPRGFRTHMSSQMKVGALVTAARQLQLVFDDSRIIKVSLCPPSLHIHLSTYPSIS